MLTLEDLFTRLSLGKLSNISISAEGSGEIIETKRAKVTQYINEALLRLYSRFVLRENDVMIELAEHILYYHLDSRYATSNADPDPNDVLYIRDTEFKPFQDDVIKILGAFDIYGRELPLNDHDNALSLFTPQPHVLQVPGPIEMKPLGVLYQARHLPLIYVDETSYAQTIDLPATLVGALESHVAYQLYSDMNGQEHSAKAAEHLMMYESICGEISNKDLVNSSVSNTSSKFFKRGWI